MIEQFRHTIWQSFLNVLAPHQCLACGMILSETFSPERYSLLTYLCQRCLDRMPTAPTPEVLLSGICKHFAGDELALSSVVARFAKEDILDPNSSTSHSNTPAISELLYRLKYHGANDIGRALGRELGETLHLLGHSGYDAIVAVPIHSARERERGYNQSEYIALGVADVLHIPIKTKLLRRTSYTLSQTYFSAEERKKNVQNVFAVNSSERSFLQGSSILLVDDILTTGSTLNACAMTLLEQGARRVDAATAAKA